MWSVKQFEVSVDCAYVCTDTSCILKSFVAVERHKRVRCRGKRKLSTMVNSMRVSTSGVITDEVVANTHVCILGSDSVGSA